MHEYETKHHYIALKNKQKAPAPQIQACFHISTWWGVNAASVTTDFYFKKKIICTGRFLQLYTLIFHLKRMFLRNKTRPDLKVTLLVIEGHRRSAQN